jgi:hypothetical protein
MCVAQHLQQLVTLQASAAFAAAAVVLKRDPAREQLRNRCLWHAKRLLHAALQYGGVHSTSIPECARSHANTGSWQQFGFWAASWLYMATDYEPYKRVRLSHACHLQHSRDSDAAQCSFASARQRPSGGRPCVGSHCT